MLATVRHHARHLVLGALVAGLLLAPAGPAAVVAGTVLAAAIAGRSRLALLAAAAVLGGAGVAEARLTALDAGRLAAMHGETVESRAVLLEPLRVRVAGPAVARVRLLDGPGAGEQAVLRASRDAAGAAAGGGPPGGGGAGSACRPAGGGGAGSRAGPSGGGGAAPRGGPPEVGDVVFVRGVVGPLGRFDAYQRRRNAHAAIAATHVVPTGDRRGGLAGALDSVRRRGERGLARGLAPPEAALLRGMVLGQDERLSEDVRDAFERSGLAHILAVSGQNVMLLAALVLGACALLGVPLRSRLILAGVLIAVYVPLAGGGPSIQRAGVMGVAGLVAALAGRPARRWYALLLAAAVTLALNPRAAGEPGWQLSFAAVAALLVGAARPARRAGAPHATRRRRGGRDHDRRDSRHRAVDGALLPAGLARRAAREPARRACDRAGDVARRARHRRGADRRAAGRAVHRARRSAARLHPASRRGHGRHRRCRS